MCAKLESFHGVFSSLTMSRREDSNCIGVIYEYNVRRAICLMKYHMLYDELRQVLSVGLLLECVSARLVRKCRTFITDEVVLSVLAV